jgi:hypothetical protein
MLLLHTAQLFTFVPTDGAKAGTSRLGAVVVEVVRNLSFWLVVLSSLAAWSSFVKHTHVLMLQDVSGCFRMLQDVAGCCRVLQDVAGCCSSVLNASLEQQPTPTVAHFEHLLTSPTLSPFL